MSVEGCGDCGAAIDRMGGAEFSGKVGFADAHLRSDTAGPKMGHGIEHLPGGYDFAEVGDPRKITQYPIKQCETICSDLWLGSHNHHVLEERVNDNTEACNFGQCLCVLTPC